MFNTKKIKELEESVKILQDQVWQLHNPPKFKVGDKYRNGAFIYDVKLNAYHYIDNDINPKTCRYWSYNIFDTINKKSFVITD